MTDRAAWTPAMRSPLVGHDDALLLFERDDAQHWPSAYIQRWRKAHTPMLCGRFGPRWTLDRAQVSCGDCLAALVEGDAALRSEVRTALVQAAEGSTGWTRKEQ